ncbi:hypothetical protein VNO77_05363 [Canavalia gladiata]|uniref:WRKY domain-containing protein n=1 Tax=Canavalia gladiata TaxID=3824 RepID=A0AAN9R9Y2_CANGL
MCNIFGPIMDNYQGDLTDIIRASGASYGSCSTGTSSSETASFSHHHWQFSSDPMNFSSVLEDPTGNFGDPFSNMRDPFLYEPDTPASAYFNTANSAEISSSGALEGTACFGCGGGVIGSSSSNTCVLTQKFLEDDMKRPCSSLLSSMIQISPNAKLPISPVMKALSRVVKPSSVISSKPSKDHCLVDNTQVQISSPRYSGFKRRKSQAKKSICVPAPAAPNSRQSGEVVPSDLWAWRKYGQKPIKGSPYPRGYYRCSSSKGCPARKQVERSRTDSNMLVITYTSEHNHPWPTHRNALAGSTRSQPSNTNNNNNVASSKKEDPQEDSNSDSNVSPFEYRNSPNNSGSVKEEKKQFEMKDGEFSKGSSCKLISRMKCNQLDQDLFAELGELEAHSLNLLSTQGLDNSFEWIGNNSTKYHIV